MKKYKKIIGLVIVVVLLLGISQITYSIDKDRVSDNKKPIFAIKSTGIKDGGSAEYIGLGYQVIIWNQLTENGDAIRTGSEINRLTNFRDLEDGPSVELEVKNR